ncbi:MAG: hypothetical protein FWD14_00870 [Treponema sp.]|nr:hypothetical protein [Treponema sp.]
MKNTSFLLSFILITFAACTVPSLESGGIQQSERAAAVLLTSEAPDLHSLMQKLDELAELERAGLWFQGMGFTESSLREYAGDYSGAVAAAFKELAWAYGMGMLQKNDLENGILNVLSVKGDESVISAANAIFAFLNGKWSEASESLELLINSEDEPDSFGRWMLLVCALEEDKGGRRAAEAYKSIRARYSHFPEYWYRGARAFSGVIAAEFAENCINISADGPFADECRKIIAAYTGLKTEDSFAIKTKKEIEIIVSQAVNSGNPLFLESLLPLINLPDNPYTTFAVGALKPLNNIPRFRDYFNAQALSAKGRLAERLFYICRS